LTADELLRRLAAVALDFSLSTAEISEVIIPRPHQRHSIRWGRAYPIVREITEGFYARADSRMMAARYRLESR